MEPPALQNLKIDFNTLKINSDNTVNVDVILTHPFVTPNNDFMGFDVRGVVYGPEVTNADAYSPLMNPSDFIGEPFGYINGLLGAPYSFAMYDAPYWGYKYFADGLGLNDDLVDFYSNPGNLSNRGQFNEGSTNSRHYDLDWGSGDYGFLIFNYSVVASYDWPVGDPPHGLDHFEITSANMAEAFCVAAYEISNTLYFDGTNGGGDLDLDVEVWDWQGLDQTEVLLESIESGVLGPKVVSVHDPGSTAKSGIFHLVDVPGEPTATGDLDLMITATDETETYGSSWFLGLLPSSNDYYNEYVYTIQMFTVQVSEEEPEYEFYWYPKEGQIGIPLAPPPEQGSREPDIGVFNEGEDQSRGTTLRQSQNLFPIHNDGYTGMAGSFLWQFGQYFNDINHLDITLDGGQCQVVSYSQDDLTSIGFGPEPISSYLVLVDTSDGSLPPIGGGHYTGALLGYDPTNYWVDITDPSCAIYGHDETSNGADNNLYFTFSWSTAPANPGPHDGAYSFSRWLYPYFTESQGWFLYLLYVYGLSTQDPVEPGPIDDTEPREHRVGVDDNTGTYFTQPSHPDTDWAEFFYIIDNANYLHMCIVEFDDPVAFVYVAGALPENWEGTAVDVEVAPAYTGTDPPLTGWGWSEVLIDKGDNTWTVMTLFWDISEDPLVVYIIHETDPQTGVPVAIDVDNDDFELHVLYKDGSTYKVTVFDWYDNF